MRRYGRWVAGLSAWLAFGAFGIVQPLAAGGFQVTSVTTHTQTMTQSAFAYVVFAKASWVGNLSSNAIARGIITHTWDDVQGECDPDGPPGTRCNGEGTAYPGPFNTNSVIHCKCTNPKVCPNNLPHQNCPSSDDVPRRSCNQAPVQFRGRGVVLKLIGGQQVEHSKASAWQSTPCKPPGPLEPPPPCEGIGCPPPGEGDCCWHPEYGLWLCPCL